MSDGGRWSHVPTRAEKEALKKELRKAKKMAQRAEEQGEPDFDYSEALEAEKQAQRQATILAEQKKKAAEAAEKEQKRRAAEEKGRKKQLAAETDARRQAAALRQRKQTDPSMWESAVEVVAEKQLELVKELDDLLPKQGGKKSETRAKIVERLLFVMGVVDTATHKTKATLDPAENLPCEEFITECSEVVQAIDRHLTSAVIDTLGAEGVLQLIAVHFGARGVREVIFDRGSGIGACVVLQRVLAEAADVCANNVDIFLTLFSPQENLRQGTKSVVTNLDFVLAPVLANASDSALTNAVVRLTTHFTRATDAANVAKAAADLALCAGSFLSGCAARFAETNGLGNAYNDETPLAKRVTMPEAAAVVLWRSLDDKETGKGVHPLALEDVQALLTRVGALWNPASTRTLLPSTLQRVINDDSPSVTVTDQSISAAAEFICVLMLSNGGEATFKLFEQLYGKYTTATNRVLQHFVADDIPMPQSFTASIKQKAAKKTGADKSAAVTSKLLGKSVALKAGESIVTRPVRNTKAESPTSSTSNGTSSSAKRRTTAAAPTTKNNNNSDTAAGETSKKSAGRGVIVMFGRILVLLVIFQKLFELTVATLHPTNPDPTSVIEPHRKTVLKTFDSMVLAQPWFKTHVRPTPAFQKVSDMYLKTAETVKDDNADAKYMKLAYVGAGISFLMFT